MTRRLLMLLSLLTIGVPLTAEELQIPVAQQGKVNIETPVKSMQKPAVLEKYGQPLKRFDSVGTPPISRWEYEHFIVYFEYEHVVHSVLKHQPKTTPEVIEIPHDAPPHPLEQPQ